MIDFSTLKALTIPEGVVTKITREGVVLWELQNDKPIILEVEKITSDTYAGETTYTGEQFILLDIYPKTNGTVNVTYGGLTKKITDTSGAEEPNAQQVFFGTFNGVSDSVATPTSGTLTIEGDCYAFGAGGYGYSSKHNYGCCCICGVVDFGKVDRIPSNGFGNVVSLASMHKFKQTNITIPSTIKTIGYSAFYSCESLLTVDMEDGVEIIDNLAFSHSGLVEVTLARSIVRIGKNAFISCSALKTVYVMGTTPSELQINENISTGETYYSNFGDISSDSFVLEKIVVPKGCGNTYKTATGWSTYADYIVEAS